jgi:hypothetical protein
MIPKHIAAIPVPVPHYRKGATLVSAPVIPQQNLLSAKDDVLSRARTMRFTILMNPTGQSSQQLFEIDQAIREVSSVPRPEVVALREAIDRAEELLLALKA